ncbi:undecaprenyl-phosphate glucose phosphotransferase [uncultured Xylophilus sp.]|uniref:undecaprenyl-phosphate glucose phosphotransferase n=1 Tax=uncultured Xylophilus sp. TaxID=296832 RepID=UPI0025D0F77F|nr:undecaprenyl-phosphate glucose phosphotransferase [uncultured Xylophilus sp.]
MSQAYNPAAHHRLFFWIVGFSAGAISLTGHLAAELYAGIAPGAIDKGRAVIVAAVAIYFFVKFEQLTSTRRMGYMLYRASLQWVSVVVVTLVAEVLLPHGDADAARRAAQLWALGTWPCMLLAMAGLRLMSEQMYGGGQTRRTIFIMPGRQAHILNTRLGRSPNLGMQVDGYFGRAYPEDQAQMHRIGNVEDAAEYLRENTCNVVFIGTDLLTTNHIHPIMDRLSDSTAAVYFVPEIDPRSPFQIDIASVADVPVLSLHENNILGMARVLKRTMDIALSLLALLVFALPMLAIALAIRRTSPGPILFRQTRYGQDGRPISMLKFRSMYVHQQTAGEVRQATRGDPRITPLGRFIRRTSMDELPQLFNVLNGSMSLVGPRPHAMEHNEFYRQQIKGYMLRHTVKPGITGWAQVNGLRGETDTLEKMMKRVEYDRFYIKHWSVGLDLRILGRTALLVVRDHQAY